MRRDGRSADMIDRAMAAAYRRFAACCALGLACAASLPMPSPGGSRPTATGEARVLAERILRRESDRLLFDERRLGALARELDGVLALVRERDPALATIRARRRQDPATLLLGVEPGLLQAIAGRGDDGRLTGDRAFDALNGRLGVRRMRLYPALRIVVLQTGAGIDIDAARRAYAAIDGVAFAEPDARPGDGSDIEAARSAGLWHVVFRRAWGDCPSGCTNAELFCFAVNRTEIRRVEPRLARGMEGFAVLLARRGWD